MTCDSAGLVCPQFPPGLSASLRWLGQGALCKPAKKERKKELNVQMVGLALGCTLSPGD